MKRLFVFMAVSAVFLSTAGCRVKKEQNPVPAPLVSISIDPAAPSMAPGTTEQLRAIGHYANNSQAGLTTGIVWASSDPSIATVGGSGLAAALQTGSTVVSASVGSITGSTTLAVSPLVSISISPADQTIAPGTALQFSASGSLLNGADQDFSTFVAWDSSDLSVATITLSGGMATAQPAVTGTTTISASFGTTTGTTTLSTDPVSSIAVTPAAATITLGATQQFTATGTLTGGAVQNLTSWSTWTSSAPSVATVGNTAGTRGLAVSTGTGTTSVTASYSQVTSNGATLTVNPATLVSLAVTPQTASVPLGGTQQFIATGTYSNGSTQDVTASATWTSTNPTVAVVSNATGSQGLATAQTLGTTTIHADFSGRASNNARVTVTPAELQSIVVIPSNPTVVIGVNVLQFTAQGTFSDGSTQDITSSVTWASSDSAVAFISNAPGSQGQAIIQASGTTTITASTGALSGSTDLTVTF